MTPDSAVGERLSRASAPPEKTFFKTLDGIRGLAALLIVVRHTGALFDPVGFKESYLAVDVFFVLSGVVLAQAYEARLQMGLGALRFAWIRLVRIYPLYILGALIAVLTILAGIDTQDRARYLGIYALLGLFLLPNPDIGSVYLYPLVAPSWSLFLELGVNVFYAAAIRRLSSARLLAILPVAAVGMVAALFLGQSHSLDIGFRFRALPFGVCRVLYSFFAGVLIYRRYTARRPASAARPATLAACAVIAAIGIILIGRPPQTVRPLYDLAAVTVIFPVLTYAALWCQPAGVCARACTFLGGVSYAVYALHAPLGDLVQDLMRLFGRMPIEQYGPWAGVIFLVLLLPFCWAIDAVYDAPVRRRLLAFRPPASGPAAKGAPAA